MARDETGRFVKGTSGNPNGRKPKDREVRYYEITMSACTYDEWKDIIKTAVKQAKRGDAQARKFLADYLIGPPPQKHEVTGKDGDPIYIVNWDDDNKS